MSLLFLLHSNCLVPMQNGLYNKTRFTLFNSQYDRGILLNCIVYAQLQIIFLNSQEHEGNYTARKFIASLFNKLSTLLARLVHSYETGISIVHASWLTKFSLSKHTTGVDPVSLAKYCSLKILSTSALRSAWSVLVLRPRSSNLKIMSCLNWSYLVNTTITGTREILCSTLV
jgi:hypothetical protein